MIVGGALAFVGSILFFISMILMNFDFNNLNIPQVSPTEITKEFSDEITSIVINDSTANISISKSYGDECYVTYHDEGKRYHLVTLNNGELFIEEVDNRNWIDFISFGFGNNSTYISVFLPQKQYESLSVYLSTGDIYVSDELTFTKANIKLSTGDVTFDAKVISELNLKTTTGDINANNVCENENSVLKLNTDVNSGEIYLNNICAQYLNANTTTGGISLNNVTICTADEENSGTMELSSTTGKIKLNNCSALSLVTKSSTGAHIIKSSTFAKLNAKSTTGGIDLINVFVQESVINTNSGDVNGTLINKPAFIPDTTSGRIDIAREAYGNDGSCEVSTTSGSITFKAAN